MQLSVFGEKFSANSGINDLMDDLGSALNENPDMLFLGGGNPGRVPDVEQQFQKRLQSLAADPEKLFGLLGIYQSPQGDRQFRDGLANLLKREFGWSLNADNISVSNGSQSAFFILFNLLAGPNAQGRYRSIHLPLAPEYIGYNGSGLSKDFFTATRPEIEYLDEHLFKYRVDFSKLTLDESMAALCVSRPTNPTGNMLTDREINELDQLARQQQIPLIIDGAYGLPFPSIVFNEAKPHWNENTILLLSLSKLGLPGVRTGIIVANEEVIQAYNRANTVISLTSGSFGPILAREWISSGDILNMSQQWVKPFYQKAAERAVAAFRKYLSGSRVPYRIHKPEGAIFLWLWFEGLPVSSQVLYERLKQRGVLVVAGHHFFPGLPEGWQHMKECIRVSYAQDSAVVEAGIQVIAEEVMFLYQEAA